MNQKSDTFSAAILTAVRSALRPLARLMLAHGLTLPTITELFKQVLVEVAIDEFPVPGKKTTDSRISVLTGVHRKDVKRLRSDDLREHHVPHTVSLGSRVVNAWLTEKPWLDKQGNPRKLERAATEDGKPGFEELAEFVSKDVRPRAILDELVRMGVVTLGMQDEITLNSEAFVPSSGVEEKLYYLQRAAYSHLSAAVHNVEGGSPAFFDRVVHYDSIPASRLDKLRSVVDLEGMQSLKKVNQSAKRASNSEGDDLQHITFGIYYYTEPVSKDMTGKKPKD